MLSAGLYSLLSSADLLTCTIKYSVHLYIVDKITRITYSKLQSGSLICGFVFLQVRVNFPPVTLHVKL